MKKVISLLVCAVMLLAMIPTVIAAGDILGYGSFETKPDVYSITIRSAEYSDEQAHTGNVSLKIKGDPKYGTGYLTLKNVILENHKKYYLSLYAYAEAGVTNMVPVAVYRVNGERKEIAIQRGSCSSGRWVKFEANFEINDPTDAPLTNTEIRFEMIDKVKEVADIVVKRNDDCAIADLIDVLQKMRIDK